MGHNPIFGGLLKACHPNLPFCFRGGTLSFPLPAAKHVFHFHSNCNWPPLAHIHCRQCLPPTVCTHCSKKVTPGEAHFASMLAVGTQYSPTFINALVRRSKVGAEMYATKLSLPDPQSVINEQRKHGLLSANSLKQINLTAPQREDCSFASLTHNYTLC